MAGPEECRDLCNNINPSVMKTILVPTDLSDLANNALAVAVDLARTYGADILLVHYQAFSIARASTAEGSMAMMSYLDEQEDADKAELQQIAENPAYQDVRITPITAKDASGLYDTMTGSDRRTDRKSVV